MSILPIYNKDKPTETGFYLRFFHGRNNPDQSLDDWSCNDPVIESFKHIHTTYATVGEVANG